MEFEGPAFVLGIIGMSMLAWIITTAIRARHGYPLEGQCGELIHRRDRSDDEATRTLLAENQQLKTTVGRLEERLKVLERIATDPSRQLADEIEQLR
jgi:hypothetical protein